MTLEQFEQTKNLFDQGLVPIQNAHLDAFLYDNKWYPLRSFVNQVYPDTNNHSAIKELVLLFPYLRIKDNVSFHGANNLPIPLGQAEREAELNLVMQMVDNLNIG